MELCATHYSLATEDVAEAGSMQPLAPPEFRRAV
jgi:hypothetical protein